MPVYIPEDAKRIMPDLLRDFATKHCAKSVCPMPMPH